MSELQEGETLEYREGWISGALEDLAALSNHQGGVLRVGVRDDGKVVGYNGGEAEVHGIAGQIAEVLGITPCILRQEVGGKSILEIRVPASLLPVAIKGRYLVRSGNSNRESTPEELARRVLKRLRAELGRPAFGLDHQRYRSEGHQALSEARPQASDSSRGR